MGGRQGQENNPPLAHRALTAERAIGLLLPCNVVVRADTSGAAGGTLVQALDPGTMLTLPELPDLAPVAAEAPHPAGRGARGPGGAGRLSYRRAGSTRPVTSPRPTRAPPGPGADAVITTSSPSSR